VGKLTKVPHSEIKAKLDADTGRDEMVRPSTVLPLPQNFMKEPLCIARRIRCVMNQADL
jgi:hypothetical protein